jgi:hypothetical protein
VAGVDALSRWRALLRYGEDGKLEMDNNAGERARAFKGMFYRTAKFSTYSR